MPSMWLYNLFSKESTNKNTDNTPAPQAIPLVSVTVASDENFTKDESFNKKWSSFSAEAKTDLMMMELFREELRLSRKDAVKKIASNKKTLLYLLKESRPADLASRWNELFVSQRRQISIAFQVRKLIEDNPLLAYAELFYLARDLFQQQSIPDASIEEIRLYQLRDILNYWVDWVKAKQQLHNALESLKAVFAHYTCPFPKQFFTQAFDLDYFPKISFLHEAGLLWKQLSRGNMFWGIQRNGTLSSFLLEQQYLALLAYDWQTQKILDKLFSEPMGEHDKRYGVYFNGVALKMASGKYLTDFVRNANLEKIPEYRIRNSAQRTQLLTEKFKQIGESTQYAIGSLEHSLASTLIRILYYQHSVFPQPYTTLKQLLVLFQQVEKEWELKKNYPIQPRLLLALHLAESNSVTISGRDWKEKLKNLFIYLTNEFEKLLTKPPFFDRKRAAEGILRSAGVPYTELHKKRYYVIDSENFNLAPTRFGSIVEQFLVLASQTGLKDRLYYEGKIIRSRSTLQRAEEKFNADLYKDRWVQAKARENLNKPRAAAYDPTVDAEAKRIAANYFTETEQHRIWVSGLRMWIGMLPVIGPLYTIEEGIRDRDAVEIVCGFFFLGLDAIDLLSGGEPEKAAIEPTEPHTHLSMREQMTVASVGTSFQKLKLSMVDLPLDDRIFLSEHSLTMEHDRSIPSTYNDAREQISSVKQGLKWNDYELVYLSNEDRVVPIKPQGGYFREISYSSGTVDFERHLIFQDPATKIYYTSTGLKGGNPYNRELEAGELLSRYTIEKTLAAVRFADDFSHREDFTSVFTRHFPINQEARASTFSAFDFFKELYDTSPTFRSIFNGFVDNPQTSPWRIEIKSKAISRADFDTKTIHIASDSEIVQMDFVSEYGLTHSRQEQIYLHELLHALTGQHDPLKAIHGRNRGPILYLTDKILSEAGYIFPQRLMYRRYFSKQDSIETEELVNLVAQENLFLDNHIDSRIPDSEYTRVFGEELMTRYTIQETSNLFQRIKRAKGRKIAEFEFEFAFDENAKLFLESSDAETHKGLISFYKNLYERSNTFFTLFDAFWAKQLSKMKQPWRFEIDNDAALSELPSNKRAHCINDLTRKVYIFSDGTLYLSNKGLVEVERVRQLVQEMVLLLTDLKDLPSFTALKNRGAAVYLTDKILEEVKLNLPKQLVYRIAMPDDIPTQVLLRNYQLAACRAVLLEDKVMEALVKPVLGCVPFCKKSRSLRSVETRNVTRNNQYAHLFDKSSREDIRKTMQHVRTRLEDSGISEGVTHLSKGLPTTQAGKLIPPYFFQLLNHSVSFTPGLASAADFSLTYLT